MKEKKKSKVTLCIVGVVALFFCIPILLKVPAIKGIFAWWLNFTDNPDYKTTYIEVTGNIIGVFISVFGALRTEDYIRKKQAKKEIEESAHFLHAELRRYFHKLQLIFQETKRKCSIEDTGPAFRDAFCEVALKYKLDLTNEWVSHLDRLNGRIGKYEWDTLQKYFSKLAVIDATLNSKKSDEIRDIYVPFICYFITTGGEGIYDDVQNILKTLEGMFVDR